MSFYDKESASSCCWAPPPRSQRSHPALNGFLGAFSEKIHSESLTWKWKPTCHPHGHSRGHPRFPMITSGSVSDSQWKECCVGVVPPSSLCRRNETSPSMSKRPRTPYSPLSLVVIMSDHSRLTQKNNWTQGEKLRVG